jgi:hypothetical protein
MRHSIERECSPKSIIPANIIRTLVQVGRGYDAPESGEPLADGARGLDAGLPLERAKALELSQRRTDPRTPQGHLVSDEHHHHHGEQGQQQEAAPAGAPTAQHGPQALHFRFTRQRCYHTARISEHTTRTHRRPIGTVARSTLRQKNKLAVCCAIKKLELWCEVEKFSPLQCGRGLTVIGN